MRTIKIIVLLMSLTFLMSSCYTQLALVQHKSLQKTYSDNEQDYYYPPATSDTLYGEEAPEIVQNFYYTPPYYNPYNLSMDFDFYYNNWWWDDFSYIGWPYFGFRAYRPFILYTRPYWLYDPFYWDYYDPYYYSGWGWYPGAGYGTHYGPRPFTKGGSLVRGAGSRRVRLSHEGQNHFVGGSSTFLPTRATGNSATSGRRSFATRKRSSQTTVMGKSTVSRKTVLKGTRSTTDRKRTMIKGKSRSGRTVVTKRGTTVRGRRYFPITINRSTRPRSTVKQSAPRSQPHTKVYRRNTSNYRNSGTYESRRWSPPSRSSSVTTRRSSPSYSAPVHTTHSRSTPARSSSRHSGSRRAVRKK